MAKPEGSGGVQPIEKASKKVKSSKERNMSDVGLWTDNLRIKAQFLIMF